MFVPPHNTDPKDITLNQRWAQLPKVPHFEILKFRWGSTSSTQKASVWLLNQNSGRRPFGLACPGMFINTDQSLSIFTGYQVEEVDPQRNFRTSKRGTLVNWAPLWLYGSVRQNRQNDKGGWTVAWVLLGNVWEGLLDLHLTLGGNFSSWTSVLYLTTTLNAKR